MITIERKALIAALTQVNKAIENRNTYPILSNVYLSAEDGCLSIRSTDLEIEITTTLECTGELAATTASAKKLLDIARKVGSEITMTLETDHLVVKSGRSRFKVAVIDPSGFPTLSQPEYTAAGTLDLAALLAPVKFAMSEEEARYFLNGIYIHTSEGGRIRAVATDGLRLAAVFGPELDLAEGIIVPSKTVTLIPEGQIKFEVGHERVRFTAGGTVIVSKLIQGTYPDYERVIPAHNDKRVTMDRKALRDAVDRCAVFASDRGGRAVKLDLAPGQVALFATGDGGQVTDEIAADYSDEPMAVGYNAKHLSEMLGIIEGDKVTFELSDPLSPARVTCDNPDWAGVAMPMRIGV